MFVDEAVFHNLDMYSGPWFCQVSPAATKKRTRKEVRGRRYGYVCEGVSRDISILVELTEPNFESINWVEKNHPHQFGRASSNPSRAHVEKKGRRGADSLSSGSRIPTFSSLWLLALLVLRPSYGPGFTLATLLAHRPGFGPHCTTSFPASPTHRWQFAGLLGTPNPVLQSLIVTLSTRVTRSPVGSVSLANPD